MSAHDYLKNHSFDTTDLCQQSDSLTLIHTLSRYAIVFLLSREQVSFNFVAVVKAHIDFGAQEKKICLCFHLPPIYLP